MSLEEKLQWIESQLTDQDVEAWHNGNMTSHVEQLMKEADLDCIAIWGSRKGPEPLSVTSC